MKSYSSKFSVKNGMKIVNKQVKYAISYEDIEKLKKKGKLKDIEISILKVILVQNYLTMKQIENYLSINNISCENIKTKIRAMVSYGLIKEESFYYDEKESFHFYSGTNSLITYFNTQDILNEREKQKVSSYIRYAKLLPREKIVRILELLARNEFDSKMRLRYRKKLIMFCTEYHMGDVNLPLYYKIKSKYYMSHVIRVGVVIMRNDEKSIYHGICVIERAAKHIFTTENAYPWIFVVCEDEKMARDVWDEHLKKIEIEMYIRIYFVKDTYLFEENVDIFDNLLVVEDDDTCIYRKVQM